MNNIQQFEQLIEIQRYSQSTKKVYNFHIKNFLKLCNGKPNQDKILDYLQSLKNYKPSSLNIAKYSIIYFFNNVLNQEINIKIPKIKKEEQLPKDMLREDIDKIINTVYNLKHKALIETAYGSGLRSSEVIKLKWEDLNFNEKTGIVRQGKGKRDRIIILSDKAINHLKEWENAQKPKSSYIFNSGKEDKPLTTRSFQQILIRASKKANLKINVFPHRLRHSFCTHLMKQGYNIRYVQKLAGHKSIKTTERYMHLTDSDIKKVVSPLDVTMDYAHSEV